MNGQALSILLAVIVGILSLSFIITLIARHLYRKSHNLPTGECACCQSGAKKLVKKYHKKYSTK